MCLGDRERAVQRDEDAAPPCSKPGSVPVGGSCANALECESAWCTAQNGEMCGSCVATSKEGEPCNPNISEGQCGFGLVCKAMGTCATPTYNPVGTPCDNNEARCDDNLHCVTQQGGMGLCVAYVGLEGACASLHCAPPLVCSAEMKCAVASKEGEDCSSVGGACGWDFYCDWQDTKTCKRTTYAKPGESCSDTKPCQSPSSCPNRGMGTFGVCPMVIADGKPCNAAGGATCDYGAHCINGTCLFANACK